MTEKLEQQHHIRSFVKRKGRKLSAAKQDLFTEILPQFELRADQEQQNLKQILASTKKLNLEIGFGAGEHLALQASHNPQEIFIGCEPFMQGVAKLLARIKSEKLDNIFIYQGDALEILSLLPDNALSKIFILFPDPWPKTKHHKRRIIKQENIKVFTQKLKQEGLLRLATDHQEYASWMIALLHDYKDLIWQADQVKAWYQQPADWVETKYQKKALAGDTYFFYNFKKIMTNS